MIIAVLTSLSPVNVNAADRYFFNQAIAYLAREKAQHHYNIYTDAPGELTTKAGNISSYLVPGISNVNNLSGFWTRFKLKGMLRKQGAEVVLCMGTALYTNAGIPSCLLIKPGDLVLKKSRRIARIMNKAASILTVSEVAKTSVSNIYNIPKEKISVIYAAAPETDLPTGEDTDLAVKEKYTGGKEYFIYTGPFRNSEALVGLMKAFSIFKKRQKTNWKLLMVNRDDQEPVHFLESLKKYKYREDVVAINEKDGNISEILAAAYTFVYPQAGEEYGLYILEAMSLGIPVIVPGTDMLKEIAADTAVYYNNTVNDLAEKMMMLYKDETSRKLQAEKAKERIGRFSWQTTAHKIWQGIEAAG